MNPAACGRLAAFCRAATPLVLVAVAVAVLLRFPPAQYNFYPQCPIRSLLHIECPGCGTTRALAALLHGNVAEALHLNALTTLMLPFAIVYAAIWYRRYLRKEPFRWPPIPRAGIYTALAISIVFTIVRNLPVRLL